MVMENYDYTLLYQRKYPEEVDDNDLTTIFGKGNYTIVYDANPPSYESVDKVQRVRITPQGYIRWISPKMPPISS